MPPAAPPTLLDLATGVAHPVGAADPFLVGRSPTANLPVTDLTCARAQFRLVRVGGQYQVEPLSGTTPTYCDDRLLTAPTPLAPGAVIRAGNVQFRFVAGTAAPAPAAAPPPLFPPARPAAPPLFPPPPPRAAPPAAGPAPYYPPPPADGGFDDRTIAASAQLPPSAGAVEPVPEIAVVGTMDVGRDPRAPVSLPHPQVSRRHAVLTNRSGRVELRDLGSANGTFVNGRRLPPGGTSALAPGDAIDIGPFEFLFDGAKLAGRSRANNIELVARAVGRVVTDRQTGKPLTLLDEVNLVIRPREFVCLLGPSGSGKSTLMGLLSGRVAPDGGTVEVNGQDLHAMFDAVKQDIALVPQKDLLHDSLSVGRVLDYTARLRLPPDTSPAETRACVDEILTTVQLTARRGTLIRDLSGGQLKRASLANEILCKPSLVFLDEVTSGLDEQTDRDMMGLFRFLADAGKTVVCITHSLANVEQTCHLVVVLTAGGKLAFVGSPAEALGYFRIARLGDVYARMAEQPAEAWQKAFRSSPLYASYVLARLPAGARAAARPAPARGRTWGQMGRLFARQGWLLSSRYLAMWRGSPAAVLAMLGQPLLVAVLLCVVFGNVRTLTPVNTKVLRTENLLFMLAVTSFWFGCNNAAKELVKERTIFRRERDFSLLAGSYYLSKLVVLTAFGAVQIGILYGIAAWWCGPAGPPAGHFAVLCALVWAGTGLGLLLSAVAPSEEVAVTLIPVAVIPQVVLAGAIAPLTGAAKYLGMAVITTYWGKRGLDAMLPKDLGDVARAGDLAVDGTVGLGVGAVLVHGAAFVLAGLVALAVQGRAAERLVHRLKKVIH